MIGRVLRFWISRRGGLVVTGDGNKQPLRREEGAGLIPQSVMNGMPIKELAVKVRRILVTKNILLSQQKRTEFWTMVQQQLLGRLQPTTDPQKIRSYSMLLYCLSKSKQHTTNFQTQFALLLPFASPASLATIAASMSRMGGFTPQFRFLLQKRYETIKGQLNVRERVAISYCITKNGGLPDLSLMELLPSMNMKELVTTMRIFDSKDLLSKDMLEKFGQQFPLRCKEINIMDLSESMRVFFRNKFYPPAVEQSIVYAYDQLKRNLDNVAFEKIWQYFPKMVNANLLSIKLVESIILTLKILHKRDAFTVQELHRIRKAIETIDNLEVRDRCRLN